MNNTPCDVIKDLLPLYAEDVCSEQSKQMIEEHLSVCGSCRKLYETMLEKPPEVTLPKDRSSFDDDVAFIKKAARKITIRQIITGGLVALILCALALCIDPLTPPGKALSVISSAKVEVADIYELKDGNIYVRLHADKKITHTKADISSVMNLGADISGTTTAGAKISYYSSFIDYISSPNLQPQKSDAFIFSPEALMVYDQKDQVYQKTNSLYYAGRGNDRKLIWKRGQHLQPAPAEIENVVEANRTGDTSNVKDFGIEDVITDLTTPYEFERTRP